MVRLVEVVLEPVKRTCPPLATPAGASRLRCVPPPRLHRGGGAGGITPLQGTPAAPTEQVRIAVGSFCAKQQLGLTDEETDLKIQEKFYTQFFLGFSEYTSKAPFDPLITVCFCR